MTLLWKILNIFSKKDKRENKKPENFFKEGLKYYNAEGVPQDYKKAAELWTIAAKQGLAQAQYNLGTLYSKGQGVPYDIDKALEWYHKAAEQGLEIAQRRFNALFQYHKHGIITPDADLFSNKPYNETEKKTVYSPEKQFRLGEKCYYGIDVTKDYKAAVEWYTKAANQGFAEAQCSLGYMYSKGKGVKQDYGKALIWYEKAANQGHAKSQFNLGSMYFNGRGVSKDIEKAKALFISAARNGYQDAQTVLDKLNKTTKGKSKIRIDNNDIAHSFLSLRERAQKSQLLFNKAKEQKRNGEYKSALRTYKQAYDVFPEDQDVQSTMYAMAKVYLLIGDYEKACALFQDGLTMKLAQNRERTGKFYQKYVMTKFSGGLSESDPEYVWFRNLTADYSIFIGLSHYLLENEGAELLSQYRYDFNNHMQSVAGKSAAMPSREYLQTCYEYGWVRVILIASEFMDRGIPEINIDHVQERKQEFLDILKTIG